MVDNLCGKPRNRTSMLKLHYYMVIAYKIIRCEKNTEC